VLTTSERKACGNEYCDEVAATGVDSSKIVAPAAWLAVVLTVATIFLLASLHILSPEFDPSWRMVSEYAFGHLETTSRLFQLSC
jgi:hypothetical protein